MKTVFSVLAAAAVMATAGSASAVVVGGINFGALGQTMHIETATLAEQLVTGNGQTLEGYGQISTVNSNGSYCAVGTCQLYYHFYDYTVSFFNGTGVQFTGGVIDIFRYDGPALLMFDQNSPANIATITGMTEWARLTGHGFADPVFNLLTAGAANATQTLNGFGVLTGATITQTGQGQVDVDTTGTFGIAAVAAYLNGNSIADNLGGFADVVLTSSTNNFVLNPLDISDGFADGCSDGTAQAGAWCLQGTLNTRGATVVPEPATLALVGLGLLGAAGVRRRTSKKISKT